MNVSWWHLRCVPTFPKVGYSCLCNTTFFALHRRHVDSVDFLFEVTLSRRLTKGWVKSDFPVFIADRKSDKILMRCVVSFFGISTRLLNLWHFFFTQATEILLLLFGSCLLIESHLIIKCLFSLISWTIWILLWYIIHRQCCNFHSGRQTRPEDTAENCSHTLIH